MIKIWLYNGAGNTQELPQVLEKEERPSNQHSVMVSSKKGACLPRGRKGSSMSPLENLREVENAGRNATSSGPSSPKSSGSSTAQAECPNEVADVSFYEASKSRKKKAAFWKWIGENGAQRKADRNGGMNPGEKVGTALIR